MSDGFVIHQQHGNLLTGIFAILLVCIVGILYLVLGEVAFERIGFSSFQFVRPEFQRN